MTRLVGYQPQLFPRLHYYARFLNADIFKISDTLQYVRRHAYPSVDGKPFNGPSYQAHTPIKTSQGLYLLDVPAKHVGKQIERTMDTTPVDYSIPWTQKHLATIEINYKKAPQFDVVFPGLAVLYGREYPSLAAFTVATTLWGLAVLFEIPIVSPEAFSLSEVNALLPCTGHRIGKVVRMSEAGMPAADKSHGEDVNAWIINNCTVFGANEYYFGGTAAAAYLDLKRLNEAGVRVVQQNWVCEPYKQTFPRHGFLPNLSIIDLVMNVAPSEARKILATPNQ
jgi:hypothetical protein